MTNPELPRPQLIHSDDEIERLVERLVALDSVNPMIIEGGAGEQAIAQFVSTWLDRAGLTVTTIEDSPARPSVVATASGTGGGRSLLLNGHLDTVGVDGMSNPHRPQVIDGRLYGRGAYDMKGGVAACMLAAAAVAPLDLAGDVTVAAVSDEEYRSAGMRAVLDRLTADAAIVTEPSHLRVCVAHKGFVWIELESIGKAAHGSRPDLGTDAITQLADVLSELRALNARLEQRDYPLLGSGSIHASMISGGQEISSYPARCTLSIERRTLPDESTTDVAREIEQIVQRATHRDPAADIRWEIVWASDAFGATPDSQIVNILHAHASAAAGQHLPLVGESMWLDSALIQAAGIPTVVYGPSGAGAHATEEWVDLDSVRTCAQVLLQTAVEFCA